MEPSPSVSVLPSTTAFVTSPQEDEQYESQEISNTAKGDEHVSSTIVADMATGTVITFRDPLMKKWIKSCHKRKSFIFRTIKRRIFTTFISKNSPYFTYLRSSPGLPTYFQSQRSKGATLNAVWLLGSRNAHCANVCGPPLRRPLMTGQVRTDLKHSVVFMATSSVVNDVDITSSHSLLSRTHRNTCNWLWTV